MAELNTLALLSDGNLKGYYRLEGNDNDSSPSAAHGTLETAITYGLSYGIYTQGALFNGSSSRINFGADLASWKFTGSYTIMGWVRKTSGDGAAKAIISNQYDGAGNDKGWSVQLNTSNQLIVTFGLGSTGWTVLTSSGTITVDGLWHHFAVRRNVNAYEFFIDGISVGTATNSTAYSYTPGTNSCVIGAAYDPSYSKFWGGYIDDIAFFNRSLSNAEILTHSTNPPPAAGGSPIFFRPGFTLG